MGYHPEEENLLVFTRSLICNHLQKYLPRVTAADEDKSILADKVTNIIQQGQSEPRYSYTGKSVHLIYVQNVCAKTK